MIRALLTMVLMVAASVLFVYAMAQAGGSREPAPNVTTDGVEIFPAPTLEVGR